MIDQAPSPQNCEWIVVPARLFTHDKMTFREDVVKPSRISPEALDEIYGKAVASKSEGHGGVVLCKSGLGVQGEFKKTWTAGEAYALPLLTLDIVCLLSDAFVMTRC